VENKEEAVAIEVMLNLLKQINAEEGTVAVAHNRIESISRDRMQEIQNRKEVQINAEEVIIVPGHNLIEVDTNNRDLIVETISIKEVEINAEEEIPIMTENQITEERNTIVREWFNAGYLLLVLLVYIV
jgi:hypothetical protein